jgi:hypothetical protein
MVKFNIIAEPDSEYCLSLKTNNFDISFLFPRNFKIFNFGIGICFVKVFELCYLTFHFLCFRLGISFHWGISPE